jgi:hypothetical protein
MRKHVIWVVASMGLLAGIRPAIADDADRVPVPSAQALTDADKLVKDVYKEDYAKRGPEERKALAMKLLDEGRNNKSDAASEYVLLREARDAAIQVADVSTAMESIEEMAKAFVVDPVELELAALTGLKATAHNLDSESAAAEACLKLIDEAVTADNFEVAGKAADLAIQFGTATKDMSLITLVQSRKTDIKSESAAYLAMKIGSDKLKKDPKDAAANYDVGSYLSLYKNDWDHGLPLMVLGNDPAVVAAAKADLASPVDAGEMLKVADAWWDLGNIRPQKYRFLRRAEFWYNLVSQAADGLMKQKADKRLDTIAESKPGNASGVGAVSEETRKALPTTVEMAKLKTLEKEWRTDVAKQQELNILKQNLFNRLTQNATQGSTADYFARCKADATMRKVIMEANDTSYIQYASVITMFDGFAMTSKDKDDFAGRIVAYEHFVASEKILDQVYIDNIIYSTIRNYVVRNQSSQFQTQQQRSDFCAWLKTKGVKSPGLDRYKSWVDRNRFAP